MKKLFTLLFSLATTAVFAQSTAPAIQWQKSLGGSYRDAATAVQLTKDGGYIIAGSSTSKDGDVTSNYDTLDYWVVKLDSIGIIQWQKSMGGSAYDVAWSIQQTNDGGYVVAGSSASADGDVLGNHGNTDYWIVKLNDTGAIQWQRSLGGGGDDEALAIQQTRDSGYIIAGYSASINGDVIGNHGNADYWVVKLNDTGGIQWQKSLGGSAFDLATSVQQTNDEGYVVAGHSESIDGDVIGNHGLNDMWIIKLDDTGAIEWQKSLGGTYSDGANAIQQTNDSGFIIAGSSYSSDGDATSNHGYTDFWVVKLNLVGVLQWQKSLGGSSYETSFHVRQTSNSGYIVAGMSRSTDGDVTGNHGSYDYWVVKLNDTGAIQWQKSLGGSGFERANAICQTSDSGYLVAGAAESSDGDVTGNHGLNDMWIVKLYPESPAAVFTPTTPLSFSLSPNPATTEVRIQTNETIRSVLVTDISGKEVFRGGAVNIIPTAELANGLYLVRVTTAKGTMVQKLSVQR